MADNEGTPAGDNASTGSLLGGEDVSTEIKDTPAVEDKSTEVVTDASSWLDSLPEELKGSNSLKKFKDVDALAKSYTELEKLVGTKGDIPKSDADEAQWNDFWNKLGRPKDKSEYAIEVPDTLKLVDGSAERVQAALDIAHQANLTKAQADKFFKGMFDIEEQAVQAQLEVQKQALSDNKAKLKEAWGSAMDEMTQEVKALESRLGVFEAFEEAGLNANADLLIALGKLAKDLAETSTIDTAISRTPQGIESEISEINSQVKEYLKKGEKVPAHLNTRLQELFKLQG